MRAPPHPTIFPYTTLFRSVIGERGRSLARLSLITCTLLQTAEPDDTVRSVLVFERVATNELRSEEHTSELQSPCNLVCRLLLEKKKTNKSTNNCKAPQ